MFPKIGIVYLSWNRKQYLDEVLSALRAQTYPQDRLELIFVDNGSVDGTAEYLRQTEGITFLGNAENLGFAEGNNMGITHALLHGCDYVFLHNDDLKLDPNAIAEAVNLAESDKTIGSVQSLMKLWKTPDVINSSGGQVHFLGLGFARDNGQKDADVVLSDGEEIAYGSGAAILLRASVLQEIGLLDPYLFLYHEDLQFGWRIRLAGFRNVLSVKSIAYHDYTFKRSIQKFYWMERNRWLVHLTCLKWQTLALIVPLMILFELPLMLFALLGGWWKEKLIVYVQMFKPSTWIYLVKTRRRIQASRRVSDKTIVSLFQSRIAHQETHNPLVVYVGNPSLSALWYLLKRLIQW